MTAIEYVRLAPRHGPEVLTLKIVSEEIGRQAIAVNLNAAPVRRLVGDDKEAAEAWRERATEIATAAMLPLQVTDIAWSPTSEDEYAQLITAGEFGMFKTEQERDAWVAERERELAEAAERLKGIGITGVDDLTAKYGDLCHLWETGGIAGEDDIILTSDSAREFADKVLRIMYGGAWRSGEQEGRQ